MHHGQLVVNKDAAGPLAKAFGQLYELRFPIRHMRLANMYGPPAGRPTDGDVTGSFSCRKAVPSPCNGERAPGRTGRMHAYGLAIDLNPVENPYVGCGMTRDKTALSYLDRSRVRPRDGHPCGRRRVRVGSVGGGAAAGPARRRTICTSPSTGIEEARTRRRSASGRGLGRSRAAAVAERRVRRSRHDRAVAGDAGRSRRRRRPTLRHREDDPGGADDHARPQLVGRRDARLLSLQAGRSATSSSPRGSMSPAAMRPCRPPTGRSPACSCVVRPTTGRRRTGSRSASAAAAARTCSSGRRPSPAPRRSCSPRHSRPGSSSGSRGSAATWSFCAGTARARSPHTSPMSLRIRRRRAHRGDRRLLGATGGTKAHSAAHCGLASRSFRHRGLVRAPRRARRQAPAGLAQLATSSR